MTAAKTRVSVVILVKDEVLNLRHTLPVLVSWAADVVVVDSFSTDGTAALAAGMGARVLQHAYDHHAQQVNWALDNLGPEAMDWILLLNADELPDADLRHAIDAAVDGPGEHAGFFLKFKVFFLGRWIRHGGTYPLWVLRLFRRGKARCEDRRMDEKLLVDGPVGRLSGHVLDDNRKDLGYWTRKHDAYSSREADDFWKRKQGELEEGIRPRWLGDPAQRRRRFRQVYDALPLFHRARLYYLYRMIVRLGVLDGREGRAWHYLQGYWYRYLVDAKILERRLASARKAESKADEDGARG